MLSTKNEKTSFSFIGKTFVVASSKEAVNSLVETNNKGEKSRNRFPLTLTLKYVSRS